MEHFGGVGVVGEDSSDQRVDIALDQVGEGLDFLQVARLDYFIQAPLQLLQECECRLLAGVAGDGMPDNAVECFHYGLVFG